MLQNEFYENLDKLKEISISSRQKYFNWVNYESSFNLHFYLKNIFLLNLLNETLNNPIYFLSLNLKILGFESHLKSTRVIIYCFNILLFKVIQQSNLTQNKALNQIRLQLIHCQLALYLIRRLLKIEIKHFFVFIIFLLLSYHLDFFI